MRPLVISVMHSPLRACTLAAVLAGVLTVTGCSWSQTTSPAAQIENDQPAIDVIARMPPREAIKSASLEDADRFCYGADYASELPDQRVTPLGTQLVFSPSWDEGGEPSQDDLAYAMYVFNLDGYDDVPELAINWGAAPADWSCCFVGLGNQLCERWDWFTGDYISDGLLTLEDLAPYLDGDGGLVLTMLMTGLDSCTLGWLRWGGNVAPIAVLEADPLSGSAPLMVSFDANASYDPDGALTDFEWDFDGDGEFNETGPEADARSSPTADYTYDEARQHSPAVRVTDNDGATDSATVKVMVGGPSDWVIVELPEAAGDMIRGTSLTVIDGCPAIGYAQSDLADTQTFVYYTRANTASGTNASDWIDPITVECDEDALLGYCSLEQVDGTPAICFSMQGSGMKYARSTSSMGTSESDWSQRVTLETWFGPAMPRLEVVAGNPAVCWADGWDVAYVRATTPTGASDADWPEAIIVFEGS